MTTSSNHFAAPPLPYQAHTLPTLRKPSTAALGFLLFGLAFLHVLSVYFLQHHVQLPSPALSYILLDIAFHCSLFLGAALVLHAARGSTTLPPPLGILLFATICACACAYLLFTWFDN